MVMDSNFPGFMEKHFGFVTTFLDKLNRNEKFRKLGKPSKKKTVKRVTLSLLGLEPTYPT